MAETAAEELARLRGDLPVLLARSERLARVLESIADSGGGGGEITAIVVDTERAEAAYRRAKRRIARLEWLLNIASLAP